MKFEFLPLAAGLLALSVGAAAAAPATVEQDLHLRAGRSTQSPVIGVLQGGSTVDARNCGGGWCAIDLRRAPATPAAAISTSRAATARSTPRRRRRSSSVRAITMTGPLAGVGARASGSASVSAGITAGAIIIDGVITGTDPPVSEVALAEHPFEDRIDVAEMVIGVEIGLDLRPAEHAPKSKAPSFGINFSFARNYARRPRAKL